MVQRWTGKVETSLIAFLSYIISSKSNSHSLTLPSKSKLLYIYSTTFFLIKILPRSISHQEEKENTIFRLQEQGRLAESCVFIKAVALGHCRGHYLLCTLHQAAQWPWCSLSCHFLIFFLLFPILEQRLGTWWLFSFESSHFSWKPNRVKRRTKIKPWNTSLVKVEDREKSTNSKLCINVAKRNWDQQVLCRKLPEWVGKNREYRGRLLVSNVKDQQISHPE